MKREGIAALRELSLHILDLIENSTRAGASIVCVTVLADSGKDILRISIDDDGPGLNVPADKATDPFYTTKSGKRTGLGLSLFKATAQAADGDMKILESFLGGVCVRASMKLSHVDRLPLGDLAGTLFTVVCANPGVDVWFRYGDFSQMEEIRLSSVVANAGGSGTNVFKGARLFADGVRHAVVGLGA